MAVDTAVECWPIPFDRSDTASTVAMAFAGRHSTPTDRTASQASMANAAISLIDRRSWCTDASSELRTPWSARRLPDAAAATALAWVVARAEKGREGFAVAVVDWGPAVFSVR